MRARRNATLFVVWLMKLTRGRELTNFWAWELTPMPVGLPSWKQIRVGFALAIGMNFVARAYQRAVERSEDSKNTTTQ